MVPRNVAAMIHRHITSRIELERINAATRQCACSSLLSLKLYFLIQMSKLDSGRICCEMPGDSFLFGVPSYSCGYTSYFLDCIYSIAHEIEKQSFSVNVLLEVKKELTKPDVRCIMHTIKAR